MRYRLLAVPWNSCTLIPEHQLPPDTSDPPAYCKSRGATRGFLELYVAQRHERRASASTYHLGASPWGRNSTIVFPISFTRCQHRPMNARSRVSPESIVAACRAASWPNTAHGTSSRWYVNAWPLMEHGQIILRLPMPPGTCCPVSKRVQGYQGPHRRFTAPAVALPSAISSSFHRSPCSGRGLVYSRLYTLSNGYDLHAAHAARFVALRV